MPRLLRVWNGSLSDPGHDRRDDPGNTPAMARAMAGLIPGARLAILPGLRHMALAESPAAVNEPLCAFLRDALGTD